MEKLAGFAYGFVEKIFPNHASNCAPGCMQADPTGQDRQTRPMDLRLLIEPPLQDG
jgi:hypothetical protein